MDSAPRNETAALEYAHLLLALHELDMQGKNDSTEAEAIRDQMDAPWDGMTPQEQERVGGLSEDLYALAEGGPPRVAMTAQQLEAWKTELLGCRARYLAGDINGWLEFWRKPRPQSFPAPDGMPSSVIHFFQAQAWEKLHDNETAAVFMDAAQKTDPRISDLVKNGLLIGLSSRPQDMEQLTQVA